MPKIIHADQTGFIKNRHGADNVRHLLHLLNTAQKNQNPMLIISMDANKAFDRIEPNFLFQMLEAMGFGEKFTRYNICHIPESDDSVFLILFYVLVYSGYVFC